MVTSALETEDRLHPRVGAAHEHSVLSNHLLMDRRSCSADDLAASLRALADPNRIRILKILAEGETTEKVLVARLMAPQPRVARHIAYLKRHGIITVRKDGRYAVCALNKNGDVVRWVKSFVDEMMTSIESTPRICPR